MKCKQHVGRALSVSTHGVRHNIGCRSSKFWQCSEPNTQSLQLCVWNGRKKMSGHTPYRSNILFGSHLQYLLDNCTHTFFLQSVRSVWRTVSNLLTSYKANVTSQELEKEWESKDAPNKHLVSEPAQQVPSTDLSRRQWSILNIFFPAYKVLIGSVVF